MAGKASKRTSAAKKPNVCDPIGEKVLTVGGMIDAPSSTVADNSDVGLSEEEVRRCERMALLMENGQRFRASVVALERADASPDRDERERAYQGFWEALDESLAMFEYFASPPPPKRGRKAKPR